MWRCLWRRDAPLPPRRSPPSSTPSSTPLFLPLLPLDRHVLRDLQRQASPSSEDVHETGVAHDRLDGAGNGRRSEDGSSAAVERVGVCSPAAFL